MTRRLVAGLLLVAVEVLGGSDVRDIGSRRELFADRWLAEEFQGSAVLKLHEARPAGVALRMNEPWEGRYSTFVTVIADTDRFRMYYRGRPNLPATGGPIAVDLDLEYQVTCYAESVDGVSWTKPLLGLVEAGGSKENNVILARSPACANFTPFIDSRPGTPPGERFKAVGGVHSSGLEIFASGDGVNWVAVGALAGVSGAFDSQNVVFWSETERQYVMYFRTWSSGVAYSGTRQISRATSPDLVTWSAPVRMTFGGAPEEELYTQQTQPYWRAPHLYLAFPNRFLPDRRVLSDREFAQADIWLRSRTPGVNDGVFMTSRGGSAYERTFMTAFMRPGLDRRNWSPRNNYAALGLIPTGEAEISLFYTRHYAQTTNHVERFTVRLDGFASISAGRPGGRVTTRPLRFAGGALSLNYATAAAGEVKVEICDESGAALPGFAAVDCDPIVGDELDRAVTWRGRSDVSGLSGRVIRLRFDLQDADVFALQFGGEPAR